MRVQKVSAIIITFCAGIKHTYSSQTAGFKSTSTINKLHKRLSLASVSSFVKW